MGADDTRAAIGESVRRAIQASGKSVDEVARLFGVKRQTVYQWQGGGIPMSRLAPLAERIGQPIVIRIGPDDRASWPEWARALDDKLDALVSEAAVRESLAEVGRTDLEPNGDGAPPSGPGSPSRGR